MNTEQLVEILRSRYPAFHYQQGSQYAWSPKVKTITYVASSRDQRASCWSLLHETGHALLSHDTYLADYELIRLEVAAWEKAQQLAQELLLPIDEDHIQDCLDTYRDWLYKRSICPTCETKSLQDGTYAMYRCFNCHTTWQVTPSRFCRAYRSKRPVLQETIGT